MAKITITTKGKSIKNLSELKKDIIEKSKANAKKKIEADLLKNKNKSGRL